MDAVRPGDDNILCILGNGFDLMHNVRSSYYALRDSIGKNNSLRTTSVQLAFKGSSCWSLSYGTGNIEPE